MYLERWTIDELEPSYGTLLSSVYNGDFAVPDADARLEVVMSLELEDMDSEDADKGVWSEEVAFVVDRDLLEGFIQRAVAANQLEPFSEDRPLREGDVYWLLSEEPFTRQYLDHTPTAQPLAEWTEQFLENLAPAGVQAWDVTAVARQAVKENYYRAIEKSRLNRPRGTRRG